MADLKISALNSLAGADLVAADVVAVVDDSASETKKLTVSDLIANGTTLISDATIPSAKILFAAGAIDTAELAASAVETAKINDSAVTAAKLADNSSVTLVSTLPASGDFTGQIALDTDDDKIYIWDGSAWDSVKGAGSINVVSGSTSGIVNITTSTSGDTVTVSTTLDDTTAAAQFLGGPTGSAGTVGYRALVGTDLPTATTSAKGGVIVNGEGLRMDSDTIEINNDVTANSSTFQAVKFDSKGLITSGRDITSADLPDATDGATGAVKPGTGLEMGTAGAIDHSNSVAAATNTKITYDAQGHVTAGTTLAASDIPDLDTAKVTTGSFATARIADDAITAAKLGDRSTATIAETTPAGGAFIGQTHLNSITGDYFLWDGNVWQPIGISVGEIVLAGTYDASTNLVATVTSEGTAVGYTVGSALPAASTSNKGHYVIVSEAGTGTSPAPTVALNPPDFLLSTGTAYTEIDVSDTVTAQQASNIQFTAAGNIAATNVQSAIEELDTEKAGAASPTFTGTVALGEDAVITFEGATDNAFETTLTVVDPTADRSLSLPNISGTLISSGDTGTVTSTMITDGTIVNADINASAEIAVSKLANGTARQLLQTDSAGTGVEFTSNVDVPGTFDCTGAGTFDSTLTVTGLISADGKVSFPAGTAAAPSFYFGTDTNTGLYHSAADEVAITTGGTQRVAVDSSGRVGIGTSSPGSYSAGGNNLVIASGGDTGVTIRTGSTDEANILFANAENASSNNGIIKYDQNTKEMRFQNYGGGSEFFTFYNQGSEKVRIDSSGRLLLGTSAARATGGSQTRYLQVEGTTYASAGLSLTCNSTSNAPTFNFGRSRGTSVGSSTVVQDGDDLGFLTWSAADGTDLTSYAAQIHAEIDGTPGSNDTPGRLIFSTTADGNAAVIERLRITSTGAWAIEGASNYGTSGQVLTSNGNDSPTWQDAAGGTTDKIEEGNTSVEVVDTGSDGRVVFTTEGSEVARFDNSGRLGLGVTPDAWDTDDSLEAIQLNGYGALWNYYNNVQLAFNTYQASGGDKYLTTDEAAKYTLDGAGNHIWYTAASGSADADITFSEKMRITNAGLIGIGVTSPTNTLHVTAASGFGAIYAQNNQSGGRVWTGAKADGSYTSEIFDNGSATFVGGVAFNKDSTNGKFEVDSNGELQIGTTFNTSSTTAQGVYISSGAVGGFGGIRVQSTSSATTVGEFFAAYRGSSAVFQVTTGGNLSCTGSLSKGSGSFKIDHPLKSETHHLVHSFVESPQADNIYRGKVDLVDGTAAVNIDTVAGMTEGTFAALNREIQCFTTNETGWTAIKGSVTGNILTITAQDDACTDSISWLVIGERQDQHMYDTEWTDDNGKVIVEPLK